MNVRGKRPRNEQSEAIQICGSLDEQAEFSTNIHCRRTIVVNRSEEDRVIENSALDGA